MLRSGMVLIRKWVNFKDVQALYDRDDDDVLQTDLDAADNTAALQPRSCQWAVLVGPVLIEFLLSGTLSPVDAYCHANERLCVHHFDSGELEQQFVF